MPVRVGLALLLALALACALTLAACGDDGEGEQGTHASATEATTTSSAETAGDPGPREAPAMKLDREATQPASNDEPDPAPAEAPAGAPAEEEDCVRDFGVRLCRQLAQAQRRPSRVVADDACPSAYSKEQCRRLGEALRAQQGSSSPTPKGCPRPLTEAECREAARGHGG